MNSVLDFAVLGLGAAAVYALLATGIVLIYRGSGVLNFAHGAIAMTGAFVAYEVDRAGYPFAVALLGGAVAGAFLGAVTFVGVLRPLAHASPLTRVMATLAVLAILQAGAILRYSGTALFVDSPFPRDLIRLGSVKVPQDRLWLTAIVVLIVAVTWWVTSRTRFGLAMSAMSTNDIAAASLGWSPTTIALATWTSGGLLGGVAGVLAVPVTSLQVTNFSLLVIPAMAAALVGRFWSFPLALGGAVVMGVVQSVLSSRISEAGWPEAVPLLAIIGLLLVSGRGIPQRSHVTDRLPSLGSGTVPARILVPAVAVLGVLTVTVLGADTARALTMTFAYGLIALSVVVLTGYAGQLSLAQASLAGIGALIAGRLVADRGWPFLAAVVMSVLVTAGIGLLFALPALRTRGVNLAVITLSLGVATQMIVFNSADLTGGISGTAVGPQRVLGVDIDPVTKPGSYAVFAMLVFTVTALAVSNVRRSRAGQRLIALRGNERAAAALGISLTGTKAYAFVLASVIASLGGVVLAFSDHVVNFSLYDPLSSINTVIFAVVGGVGYIAGALFGAILAPGAAGSLLLNSFDLSPAWLSLVGGAGLVLLLLQSPDGGIPKLLNDLRRMARRGEKPASAASPAADLPAIDGVAVPAAPLRLTDVTVRYGTVVAIDQVSLTVTPGRITGLIGANGAGKTTLIDAVTGFTRLSSGQIELGGKRLDRLAPHRRARLGLSRSFQSLELFDDLTVRENLVAASDDHRWLSWALSIVWPGRPAMSTSAVAAVRQLGLEEDLDRKPPELSNGRRRLVAIARAIAAAPSVLLLDEPAAGLDESETAELGRLLVRLAHEWGFAILLVEHDVAMVMDTSDVVVAIDFGRKIADGVPAEVRQNPQVIAAYLGARTGEPAEQSGVAR